VLNISNLCPDDVLSSALLWHQLMGKTVLAANSDVFSPSLRTYAHCSKGRVSALSSYRRISCAKEIRSSVSHVSLPTS